MHQVAGHVGDPHRRAGRGGTSSAGHPAHAIGRWGERLHPPEANPGQLHCQPRRAFDGEARFRGLKPHPTGTATGHNGGVAGAIDPFASLRLTGGRFEGDGMPVETLSELVAYRELVVGVAKELFRREHPDRHRVPRGFEDGFQLRLRRVDDGSAVPVLERVFEAQLVALDDEFTHARDLIEQAVEAIAAGAPLPGLFPTNAIVFFNRLGQTLRPDEAIELRAPGATEGPRFTTEIRKMLVLEHRLAYQEEVDDVGWISEVDGTRMTCMVRLQSGPPAPVSAPLDELTFIPVKDVLAPNGEGPPVRISGIGVFDASHRLLRLDSLHDVSPLDDTEEWTRLDGRFGELAQLEVGWLDGEGVPPDAAILQRARAVLVGLLDLDVPRPRVFATLEGGVQAEWSGGGFEVSVTFEPDGTLYAIAVNSTSGESEEPDLAPEPAPIAQFVRRRVS